MSINKIQVSEAIDRIKKLNPKLAKEIEIISPDEGYYLYEISYPYGASIVDRGIFQVPDSNNHIVPLNHSTIGSKIKDDLGYSGTIPLGIITNNSIEAFMLSGNRVIPSSIVKPGNLISLWRVLDEGISFHTGKFWNITSGARSICMLPKITDTTNYKNLKTKFGLKLNVPQSLSEHWELFVKIANHSQFSQSWESSILFFPKKWMSHKNDRKWKGFYNYLFETVWQSSNFRRNQFITDFAFSLVQENRNLKPNPYLADTVKHLVAIGGGAVEAFCPAIDNSAAPIQGLQQVFIEIYGLKKYAPIIMHMHHFSLKENRPVYYSLQLPTTTIFSPKSRKLSTLITELDEVKYIMEVFLAEVLKENLEVEGTPLYELAKNVRYNYFHSEKDKHGEILLSNNIPLLDTNFSTSAKNSINNINVVEDQSWFPEFATFFKGCISISKAE
jgi:hypothetical protein